MKKFFSRVLPIVLVAGFTVACEEDGDGDGTSSGDLEKRLSEAYLKAEEIASNLYTNVDAAKRQSISAGDTAIVNGAAVYINNNSNLTVDYGTGTISDNGVLFAGIIEIQETGDYFTTGGKVQANLVGFAVEGQNVSGSLSVENKGSNAFEIIVSNLALATDSITFNAPQKTITWAAGFTTLDDDSDDRYSVSGSATAAMVGSNESFSSSILEPLMYDRTCSYGVTQGIINVVLTGDNIDFDDVTLDFIDTDNCNNQISITVRNTETDASLQTIRTFDGF